MCVCVCVCVRVCEEEEEEEKTVLCRNVLCLLIGLDISLLYFPFLFLFYFIVSMLLCVFSFFSPSYPCFISYRYLVYEKENPNSSSVYNKYFKVKVSL